MAVARAESMTTTAPAAQVLANATAEAVTLPDLVQTHETYRWTMSDNQNQVNLVDSVQTYEPVDCNGTDQQSHTPHTFPINYVAFYHPGYTADGFEKALLELPAVDHSVGEGSDLRWGLHYGVAITVCSIVACNRSGYLTEGTANGPRVIGTWDQLLLSKVYYFHVEQIVGGDEETPDGFIRYPVCPTFSDWVFPSSILPEWVSCHVFVRISGS